MKTQAKRISKWNNKVHFILHVVFKTDSFLLFIPGRLPVTEPQCFYSPSVKNHICESRTTTLKRTYIKNVMHSLSNKKMLPSGPTKHVFLQIMSFNVLFSCTSPFFTHRSVHGICHAHSNGNHWGCQGNDTFLLYQSLKMMPRFFWNSAGKLGFCFKTNTICPGRHLWANCHIKQMFNLVILVYQAFT